MPRTTERSGDRFKDTLFIHQTRLAFNSAFDTPIVAPYATHLEVMEIGVSVGTITGGTAPGCTLEIFGTEGGADQGVLAASKGNSVYSGVNTLVCDASKTLLKVFEPEELVLVPLAGANIFDTLEGGVYNVAYGWAGKLRCAVSGSPTSIAIATVWARFRPYWME